MDSQLNSMVFLYMLLLFGWTTGDNMYCSLCKTPGSHTMCTYSTEGPGAQCKGYQHVPFTEEEKHLVVQMHNELRNKVALGTENRGQPGPQPSASNMMKLTWDDELASIAQRWADQCVSFFSNKQHDKCRNTEKYSVGQNIACSGKSGSYSEKNEHKSWVMMWFDEIDEFDKAWAEDFSRSAKSSSAIGHYSQLVWAHTSLLGCGKVVFSEVNKDIPWTFGRLVCNYAPGGNMLNRPVYLTGNPCSACPSGTTCDSEYKGLCSAVGGGSSSGVGKERSCHVLLLGLTALLTSLQIGFSYSIL